MYTFKELQKIIEQELSKLNLDKQPNKLYQPIKYILSIGGKRLRPVLVLMSCNLFSDDIQKAINSALSLEVFHNFTLLHDDIMDKSEIRRNQITVHKKWNENIAILSGDAMFSIAFRLAIKTDVKYLKDVLKVFTDTSVEVCEGQQYDMDFETKNNVSEEEYINMIRLKTAVLISACLKTGAIIGEASKKDIQNLYDFGINIGLAFQLQDDYLDVYGNIKNFGKQTGNDIYTNKKTYLLIKSLELAKGETKQNLENLLNDKNINKETKIQKVTAIYNQLNVKVLSQNKMYEYLDCALDLLEKINVPKERKQELKNLAIKLMKRSS